MCYIFVNGYNYPRQVLASQRHDVEGVIEQRRRAGAVVCSGLSDGRPDSSTATTPPSNRGFIGQCAAGPSSNTVHLTNISVVFCFWGPGLHKEVSHACCHRGVVHPGKGCLRRDCGAIAAGVLQSQNVSILRCSCSHPSGSTQRSFQRQVFQSGDCPEHLLLGISPVLLKRTPPYPTGHPKPPAAPHRV
jgi:hypothetical protein